jgi:hypothetical protein
VPHTPNASKYWGSNTKWCISGRDNQSAETMFPSYNSKSPIIMILPKGRPDNKVALVDHTRYDSADEVISILPNLHQEIMDRCLENLSEGARKNITPWVSKISAAGPTVAGSDDSALTETIRQEMAGIFNQGKKPDANLWKQRDFKLAAIKENAGGLQHTMPEILADRDIMMAAVKQDGGVLYYAAPELRQDREVVLAAVRQKGTALHFAAPELKRDREIVMAAIQQDAAAFSSAAQEFHQDRDLVLSVVRRNGRMLICAQGLWNDREIALAAVRQDGRALKYASTCLKRDHDIVLAAVQQDCRALFHALLELREDRRFIAPLLEQSEDLPFQIRGMKDRYVWQPDEAALQHYQLKALEKMAERGDNEKFAKYVRHMQATWGDPGALFAADPAATLKKIRAAAAARSAPVAKLAAPRRAYA